MKSQREQFCLREQLSIHAIHILFRSDERLTQFLFHHKEPRLRLQVGELLQEASFLSHAEFLQIQVAVDLWCGEARTALSELLSVLDDQAFLRVLQALTYKREMVEAWEALQCCE